mgnify:CR=1 FL=1
MRTSHPASLLVAALVMLRRPCARSQATAQLLLERAAENTELSSAEREACLELADELERERPQPAAMHTKPAVSPRHAAYRGEKRRLSRVAALPLSHDMEGSIA